MPYVSATGGAGNSVVYTDHNGCTQTWSGGHRNWRNNNPGNIAAGSYANNHGAIGSAGGFAVFPDSGTGFSAAVALWGTSGYANGTLGQGLSRWAAGDQNYLNCVAQGSGYSLSAMVNTLNASTIVSAQQTCEGGASGSIGELNCPY